MECALREVAPIAQAELAELLRARPLVDDEAPPDTDDEAASEWNRAAWFGWQFMSLRDAKPWMPKTIRALDKSSVPLAHRFIGIARQRPECRGTLHSDRRNYLLSTLTGLQVPTGQCAVVVPGVGERMLADGEVVVLDNTFKHFVYNNAKDDRFVLMAEVWHPELTAAERSAIATTFAVKDKFTLTKLRQCPWGFSDDELSRALASGQYTEIDFWRNIAHGLE